MTNEQANKIIRVLATEERVFGLEVDSLIREGGNSMTAGALFRTLHGLDLDSEDFPERLAEFIREMCVGDPSMLIGYDDGRWVDLPVVDEDAEGEAVVAEADAAVPTSHCLRIVHVSEDASFYLFHAGGSLLDGSAVVSGARKREGAVHHVRVELSDAAQLQHIITRARQCPHVVRVEESSEEEFWAAPSHNPGY
jgi:hypothetical protein